MSSPMSMSSSRRTGQQKLCEAADISKLPPSWTYSTASQGEYSSTPVIDEILPTFYRGGQKYKHCAGNVQVLPKYLNLAFGPIDAALYAGISDDEFENQLASAFLLSLAQQTVHSHVNMGLQQGDFAPVASSDVRLNQSLASIISQSGDLIRCTDKSGSRRKILSRMSSVADAHLPISQQWYQISTMDSREEWQMKVATMEAFARTTGWSAISHSRCCQCLPVARSLFPRMYIPLTRG